MRPFARRVVDARWFEPWMIALILFNGVLIGLETSHEITQAYGRWLELGNDLILGIFVIEAALKITAVAPNFRRYFGDGWNLFDFSVIVLSLLPATGQFALVARLIRVLRVLRLVSAMPQLRLIVATLVRSIPSMGHVLMLLGIVFYIYAITGFHLFHNHDAEHWGTLGAALLTLFQIVTLEGWVDVMEQALESRPWSWVYFVSFVLIGTFVVLNLFIAVVVNNLEASKAAELEALARPVTHDEVLDELGRTRDALRALQRKLAALPEVERPEPAQQK
ncbi:MAG TPA: ion transporter [Burkholderiales bacterium]|nr:ion transporter [Burkholderiales bacterium]